MNEKIIKKIIGVGGIAITLDDDENVESVTFSSTGLEVDEYVFLHVESLYLTGAVKRTDTVVGEGAYVIALV